MEVEVDGLCLQSRLDITGHRVSRCQSVVMERTMYTEQLQDYSVV